MKISELIFLLQKKLAQHGDREVEVTWESIQSGIESDSVYLSKKGPLYIDGDGNAYKEKFAVNPKEGEELGA